jgi:putative glycosyltransferase (TIGR04372 family)
MIHVRDNAFLNKAFPNCQWHHDDFRNGSIVDFLPIIRLLIELGYTVFRSGRSAVEAVPLSHSRFFDMPFSDSIDEDYENFLWTNASFSVTTGSGPDLAAVVAGVPTLAINYWPPHFPDEAGPYTRMYLRPVKSLVSGRVIPFNALRSLPLEPSQLASRQLSLCSYEPRFIEKAVSLFEESYKQFGKNLGKYGTPRQRYNHI